METSYTAVAAVFLIGIIAAYQYLTRHDPREPPRVSGGIPVVGHIIGMIRHSFNYHLVLSRRCGLPIFTMQLPGSKMYVITSPDLIQAVQKQHKTLSPTLIRMRLTNLICGLSKEALRVMHNKKAIGKEGQGEEVEWPMMEESFLSMHATLKPGKELDQINRPMVDQISSDMDAQTPAPGGTKTLKLWEWTQKTITDATAIAAYGPDHPFKDPELVKAFWRFESDLTKILLNPVPSITAKEAIAAREKLTNAFEKYHANNGHDTASSFAREFYTIKRDLGVPARDCARLDVIGAVAVLVNTVPSSFWTLLLICSQPDLLRDVRAEIDATITSSVEDGKPVKKLDITDIKENCPLLASTLQEMLRYRTVTTTIREVTEDTMLKGQYLLKKGAVIQIPSRAVHADAGLWGTDVDEFRPRRFMEGELHLLPSGKKPGDSSFRAFGGGKTLCPGRHFAINEIMAFVAAFVSRFDMTPVSGEWKLPTTANTSASAVIMTPDEDVPVTVRRRKGFEDCSWKITLKPTGKVLAFADEDKTGSG